MTDIEESPSTTLAVQRKDDQYQVQDRARSELVDRKHTHTTPFFLALGSRGPLHSAWHILG